MLQALGYTIKLFWFENIFYGKRYSIFFGQKIAKK